MHQEIDNQLTQGILNYNMYIQLHVTENVDINFSAGVLLYQLLEVESRYNRLFSTMQDIADDIKEHFIHPTELNIYYIIYIDGIIHNSKLNYPNPTDAKSFYLACITMSFTEEIKSIRLIVKDDIIPILDINTKLEIEVKNCLIYDALPTFTTESLSILTESKDIIPYDLTISTMFIGLLKIYYRNISKRSKSIKTDENSIIHCFTFNNIYVYKNTIQYNIDDMVLNRQEDSIRILKYFNLKTKNSTTTARYNITEDKLSIKVRDIKEYTLIGESLDCIYTQLINSDILGFYTLGELPFSIDTIIGILYAHTILINENMSKEAKALIIWEHMDTLNQNMQLLGSFITPPRRPIQPALTEFDFYFRDNDTDSDDDEDDFIDDRLTDSRLNIDIIFEGISNNPTDFMTKASYLPGFHHYCKSLNLIYNKCNLTIKIRKLVQTYLNELADVTITLQDTNLAVILTDDLKGYSGLQYNKEIGFIQINDEEIKNSTGQSSIFETFNSSLLYTQYPYVLNCINNNSHLDILDEPNHIIYCASPNLKKSKFLLLQKEIPTKFIKSNSRNYLSTTSEISNVIRLALSNSNQLRTDQHPTVDVVNLFPIK